jgi:hypothetical protein
MRNVVTLGLLLVLGSGPVWAADQLIFGRKLKGGTSVLFTSNDASITPPVAGSADDPTLHYDWYYDIFADDADFTFQSHSLPPAYWTVNAAGTGYKYSSPFASASVRSAVLKAGKLKVKIQVGSVPFLAGEPIAVVLRNGSLRYCARFEPSSWVVVGPAIDDRFVAKNAPAPVECPTYEGSPSGAFVN